MLEEHAALRAFGEPHWHRFAAFTADVVPHHRGAKQTSTRAWTLFFRHAVEDRRIAICRRAAFSLFAIGLRVSLLEIRRRQCVWHADFDLPFAIRAKTLLA